VKRFVAEQKAIHYALKEERNNILMQEEKNQLISSLKAKDDIIRIHQKEIEYQKKLLSETEKKLSDEKDISNSILNIQISDERLRNAVKKLVSNIVPLIT
jgi:hypothetical protein